MSWKGIIKGQIEKRESWGYGESNGLSGAAARTGVLMKM